MLFNLPSKCIKEIATFPLARVLFYSISPLHWPVSFNCLLHIQLNAVSIYSYEIVWFELAKLLTQCNLINDRINLNAQIFYSLAHFPAIKKLEKIHDFEDYAQCRFIFTAVKCKSAFPVHFHCHRN